MSPPILQAPGRDLRLDAIRGFLQLSIFYSHAYGSLTGAWLIHAGWGVSDSSEQFVFLSGFGLGSVFILKQARGGFSAACKDLGLRFARLWRMHMLVFMGFGLMVAGLSAWVSAPGWSFAFREPLAAALGGAILMYQPPFMGILPLFLFAMATLPAFAWAIGRWGAGGLLLPAMLYLAAQWAEADLPGLFGTTFSFHPFGWIPLFMLGAWFGRQALLRGYAIGRNPWLMAGAIALILVGAVMHRSGFLPVGLVGKEQLAPLRLLHALACAYLVAVLVPRDMAWTRWWIARALAVLGRHSLPVFSLGLFFSSLAAAAFSLWPMAQWWSEPLLLVSGSLALWRVARHLENRRGLYSAHPRQSGGPGNSDGPMTGLPA